jgi:hypothetical protein
MMSGSIGVGVASRCIGGLLWEAATIYQPVSRDFLTVRKP